MRRESSGSVRIFYPRFDQEELIRTIQERLVELEEKLPLLLVILFGSYAQGNYTVKSDVDLLVIYKGRRRDAFATIKRTLNIPLLEPHIYSEDEYKRLKGRIDQMTKNGIVLLSRSPFKL